MTPFANPKSLSLRARLMRPLIRRNLGRIMSGPMSHEQQRRALLHAAARMKPFHATGGRTAPQVTAGVPGLLVTPTTGQTDSLLIYFHGGGYAVGAAAVYTSLATRIAALTGARVLLPDYRLAPENPFPAGVTDALAVYRSVLESGVPAARIVLAGDSAGGGLALACALSARDAGLPQPAGIVMFSPWTDLTSSGDSIRNNVATERVLSPQKAERFVAAYLGDGDRRQPLASPLFANLQGLPPFLIQVDAGEILLDDSTRLAARAGAAGVTVDLQVWSGLWHVWQAMAGLLPEADLALQSVSNFLLQCWKKPVT